MSVLALDLGHTDVGEAERWLAQLPPVPGLVACTHVVPGEPARVVVTLAAPGRLDPTDLPPAAERRPTPADGAALAAARAHATGVGGRAVVFPGSDRLRGLLPVADVLAHSAIGRVTVVGEEPEPADHTLVDIGEVIRPQWMDGVLTLIATPTVEGRLTPVEVPADTGQARRL